jgi:hypothetical protein
MQINYHLEPIKQGASAHTCSPKYLEAGIGRIEVSGKPRKLPCPKNQPEQNELEVWHKQ